MGEKGREMISDHGLSPPAITLPASGPRVTLCRVASPAATGMRIYASSASRRMTKPLHRQASWVRLAIFDLTGPSAEQGQCILELECRARCAFRYDPSVSHGQHQSWGPHICAKSDSRTVPKPALGNLPMAATCRVTTLAELPICKLSPWADQSTEQALLQRQMHIKPTILV